MEIWQKRTGFSLSCSDALVAITLERMSLDCAKSVIERLPTCIQELYLRLHDLHPEIEKIELDVLHLTRLRLVQFVCSSDLVTIKVKPGIPVIKSYL